EVMIGTWKKGVGEQVVADESVVEIESDKATVELPAPSAGVISQILKQAGEQATVGEVIGYLDTVGAAGPPPAAPAASPSQAPQPQSVDVRRREGSTMIGSVQPAASGAGPVMPAAARVLGEAGVPPQSVAGSGPGGRVTKSDAMAAVAGSAQPVAPAPPATTPGSAAPPATAPALSGTTALAAEATAERAERAVLISPIRRRIAERLVEAQHEAALLTTFNEVDMSAVMAVRKKFKDSFSDRHGVKLGFMSFFVRAAVEALRAVPQVNAEFRDPHIVYRDYCDIGIAVGGGKGLVVPVLRNAEQMNFAEIEQAIGEFARRAAENKLKLEELQGGTFTISNGGVYGSMMSTPIINPPQSGILGLHAIQERPVAVDGQVVIRPMMYLALTYDHRLVDGREAVTFLKRVKDTIEDPTRLMLEC
ncbi:MAG: 2-oxoglutarate dehydrogenase complex dihydrolipoyllysine-residue succinyltransferase, partial [Planctomycetia bacterium]|nr:2-oxoglutarate dehydrogenase complex dihydrolipoyllysine-residue succinyltransferase [Planctomycetia bacterium]